MKKYAVALAALLALTACGGNEESKTVEAPQKAATNTVAPTPTPTPVIKQDSPESAVRAYSKEFLTGHGYDAYKRLSKRCAATIDRNYFEGLTLAAKETYGNVEIETYEEKVDGNRAVVTYTFAVPAINQTNEEWVKEGGVWKYDQC